MLSKFLSLTFLLFYCYYASAESIEHSVIVKNHCDKISTKLASVNYKECLSHHFEVSEGQSVSGLPILVKKFNPNRDKNSSVRTTYEKILLVGGVHGNEYSTVSVVFKWITLLNQYYTGNYHWQIVPLLNADGLLQSSSKRVNANGVDLDRNFPVNSDQIKANQYWEENTHWAPEYFPGKEALSEPESRWLAEEIERYKPDIIITVHAPINSDSYKLGNSKQTKLGAQYQNTVATYPGSLNQYVNSRFSIPILTVELPYADIMPTRSEINKIWANIIEWLNEKPESP